MHRQRYNPKTVARPGGSVVEAGAELKGKLYAVKISLGDHVLAEGVVELPQNPKEKYYDAEKS